MTVKELQKELSKFPDDMEVFVGERLTEFSYGLVNSCYSKEISFTEDHNGTDEDEIENGTFALETVVILDEQ